MRVSVCLGAILIPEYLDFYSSYSAPKSRIAGINSGIYSYSGISQTNAPLRTNATLMLHRANALSSTTEAFNEKCTKLRSIFSHLDYPLSLID